SLNGKGNFRSLPHPPAHGQPRLGVKKPALGWGGSSSTPWSRSPTNNLHLPRACDIGLLYGPGTWHEASSGQKPALHVDAAAHAALLAITQGAAGVYNIADDDGAVSIAKARAELGFDPGYRAP